MLILRQNPIFFQPDLLAGCQQLAPRSCSRHFSHATHLLPELLHLVRANHVQHLTSWQSVLGEVVAHSFLAKISHFFKIGSWGAELNRESFCVVHACVRMVCMSSEIGVKIYQPAFSLFPFRLAKFSLFPSLRPQILYTASAGFIRMYGPIPFYIRF